MPVRALPRAFLLYATILFPAGLMIGALKACFQKRWTTCVICNRCHVVKNLDELNTCDCGGHFEDIFYWKWVKDTG